MKRRYPTSKPKTDPTYSQEWSGVTGAPYCSYGCTCPTCGNRTHPEGDSHYCDDYKAATKPHHKATA